MRKRAFLIACCLVLSLFTGALAEYSVPELKKADLKDGMDEKAVRIEFDGDSVHLGEGAEFADRVLTITEGGTYVLSGASDDAQVRVIVSKDDKVRLILDNLTLRCSFGPCIRVDQTDKATVTLLDGSVNTLTDTENYILDEGDDEPNACLFSKDDLSINGSGALVIRANYKHGINCKDDLKIVSGSIQVTAAGDGIRGKDSVLIAGGSIHVEAKGDGIKSNNDEDSGKGFVYITGGEIIVKAGEDAIQGAQGLIVEDGTIHITTGEGSSVLTSTTQETFFRRGGWGSQSGWDRSFAEDTVSMKGLKSDGILVVTGGSVTADTEDDSLHASGEISLSGGILTLSSGDDGVHSDASIEISGGSLRVLKSYEGVEAPVTNVIGGVIDVTANDDGFNCAGGEKETVTAYSGNEGFDRSFGGMMADANANNVLRFTGGHVHVNAGGDGLDSNGYIYMEGGTVLVDGPTDNGNAALDSGYSIIINGGILVAAGSSGMAEMPDASSAQCCVAVYTSGGGSASLVGADRQVLIGYTPQKDYACVIFSSPALQKGSAVQAVLGGTFSEADEAGLAVSGSVTGGEVLGSAELMASVSAVGKQMRTNFGTQNSGPQAPGGRRGR